MVETLKLLCTSFIPVLNGRQPALNNCICEVISPLFNGFISEIIQKRNQIHSSCFKLDLLTGPLSYTHLTTHQIFQYGSFMLSSSLSSVNEAGTQNTNYELILVVHVFSGAHRNEGMRIQK